MTHMLQATIQGLTIRFAGTISDAQRISISTYKLLDALTVIFTLNSASSRDVKISVREYAGWLGVADLKAVRAGINRNLALLDGLRLSYQAKKKDGTHIRDAPILTSYTIRRGIVHVTLSEAFESVLKQGSVMQCPTLLWKIRIRKNPHSYFLLRRLAEHKKTNRNGLNANKVSVRTLLAAVSSLPAYGEIAMSTRHVSKQIIRPFERDMNALSEILTWRYYQKGGRVLPPEEAQKMSYYQFENMLIEIVWRDYPQDKQPANSGQKSKNTNRRKKDNEKQG